MKEVKQAGIFFNGSRFVLSYCPLLRRFLTETGSLMLMHIKICKICCHARCIRWNLTGCVCYIDVLKKKHAAATAKLNISKNQLLPSMNREWFMLNM